METTDKTPAELAERFQVPVSTIYQWRFKGYGPKGYRLGKHLRFRDSDIETWVQAQVDASN